MMIIYLVNSLSIIFHALEIVNFIPNLSLIEAKVIYLYKY